MGDRSPGTAGGDCLMGNQVCSNGHRWKTRFTPAPSELRCPEDGCGLPAEPTLKARLGGPGLGAPEARPLADAHARFSGLVTEWPCFFKEHRCGHSRWGDIDPHHLIPADWIKQNFRDLPDIELADILYAPILGTPLCRKAHEAVEARTAYIHWHELDRSGADRVLQADRSQISRTPSDTGEAEARESARGGGRGSRLMPNWTLEKLLENLGLEVDQILSMPAAEDKQDADGFHLSIDGEHPFERTPIRLKQGDIEVEIFVTKQG